ncbi:MAG TPA: lmo0937 family membrane protein [Candidatus Angelobacter sp.]|nr:lmo0937 family membrane protein [Candidatus Angelobacter sp.]
MLWAVVAVLLIMWLLGFSFRIAGNIVHLFLIVALGIVVINFFRGRQSA